MDAETAAWVAFFSILFVLVAAASFVVVLVGVTAGEMNPAKGGIYLIGIIVGATAGVAATFLRRVLGD